MSIWKMACRWYKFFCCLNFYKKGECRLRLLNKEDILKDRVDTISQYHILDYLKKDDVLVINDTKVIPARLIGEKTETKAVIELLLLKDLNHF